MTEEVIYLVTRMHTNKTHGILELGDCLVGFGTCFISLPELMVAASQVGTVPATLVLQTSQLPTGKTTVTCGTPWITAYHKMACGTHTTN